MAEFCKQCSLEIFGEDFGDLADLIDDTLGDCVLAMCEGCGLCYVNYKGECCVHFRGFLHNIGEQKCG